MMKTMLKRKQTQSTRNQSQQASKSHQAKVFNLTLPQKAEAIYKTLLTVLQY